MDKKILFLFLIIAICSCSESDDLSFDNKGEGYGKINGSFERLSFDDEEDLANAILNKESSESAISIRSSDSKPFISMMDVMTNQTESQEFESDLTYYKAQGYDTLVPNPNFAKLLTPLGELEVDGEVFRITPLGTYKYPVGYEEAFNKFIASNPENIGQKITEDLYKINDYISIYRTFDENANDYELLSEGYYRELPDDFFGDDDESIIKSIQTRAVSEPDFNSFQTFSANRKTVVGKLIQRIIGSTKSSSVKFNKKRRVRGSFYFYNYGVYGEIGIKGCTEKKNWIGWSNKKSDELRVGWNQVVLKQTIPDFYKQAMKDLNSMVYYPPKYVEVNGMRVNCATLAMPEFKATLKDKVISQGAKAIHNYLKHELKRPASEWEKAQAFIIATRTELYFVHAPQNVIKYNSESFTHVFAKNWMDFTVGWSNQGGFFINKINQNNVNQIGPWFNAIAKTFNEKKTELVGGEVYVCARFGNEWRGMKIIKK